MDHSNRNRDNELSYTRAVGDYSADQISMMTNKARKSNDLDNRLFRQRKSGSDKTDDTPERKESQTTGRKRNFADSPQGRSSIPIAYN